MLAGSTGTGICSAGTGAGSAAGGAEDAGGVAGGVDAGRGLEKVMRVPAPMSGAGAMGPSAGGADGAAFTGGTGESGFTGETGGDGFTGGGGFTAETRGGNFAGWIGKGTFGAETGVNPSAAVTGEGFLLMAESGAEVFAGGTGAEGRERTGSSGPFVAWVGWTGRAGSAGGSDRGAGRGKGINCGVLCWGAAGCTGTEAPAAGDGTGPVRRATGGTAPTGALALVRPTPAGRASLAAGRTGAGLAARSTTGTGSWAGTGRELCTGLGD